jgi:hypothetical protein
VPRRVPLVLVAFEKIGRRVAGLRQRAQPSSLRRLIKVEPLAAKRKWMWAASPAKHAAYAVIGRLMERSVQVGEVRLDPDVRA